MPFVVKSGAKTIGTVKRRTQIKDVLAKEFRRENKVSVFKLVSPKGNRKKRGK